jgi:hypothetical protein
MRLPAFLFHLAGLVAFYLAVREGAGVQRALLSLAVLAATPVSIVYAGLLNYENPALALVLVAALFHVRYLKRGETRDLVLFGVAALVGCAVTFFHLFFVPPLVAQAFLRRSPGARDHAVRLAAAAALGAALPIALHAWLSSLAFERASQPPSLLASRIEEMLRPLVDGSVPFPAWLGFQLARAARYLSEPILVAAVVGAVLAAARALRPGPSRGASPADGGPAAVELTLPLLAGAGLLLVVMFRHTADGIGGGDGQASFVLHLAPGAAAAAGLVLDALSRPLLRLRGGVAPLVVLTSLVCLPAVARANELRRPWREPGPRDDPSLETGPAAPLPSTVGRELNRLLPAGDAAVYPSSLGLTPAHIYYAWRSLLPVDVASAGSLSLAGTRIADHRGETWILVPRSGPRAAVTAGETLHAFIAERVPSVVGEPEVATEHWWLWRLAR